ncbi:acetyl/propionyl-CoA carboxylase alpha subunit [Kocuria sp. AG109]|uniref:acetyl/propionyl/methylcrotonyl-CoA carboxylase subunit alpha n=1 Tax=Rothia kristinae TaxID=37923 RepID=UPI00077406C7|nr:biotin carboxylase N-terminal domain-containing protein [Rothia kristinae]TDP54660.1 acetyl/propionyl-CoA carboxylase alpha subunit [Kocuria sp. AG109]MCT1356862.1 ATP-grasp domain-containing protein [Rothia kristinae]MCT1392593.1 ATP-grasp domain-containing protein [Rothia kristinae]MCT1505928.1 ATP-grasp domain-containing protein [Rothia kristinae]MCT2037662.1 ATP-grasp domain-containing protein [Rothia kristinae]
MRTVLIANRSEIAVRIIRACAERGIRTVAVYADADAEAPHVLLADEAYALEGDSPAETYLDQRKLLEIARRAEATDVHPGYGFLAESADFARAVIAAGLRWIGPSPETIEALGDKIRAREIARAAGAPLAPGTDGPLEDAAQARAFAEEHGLPIIIKAAHGGGGRGMRVVREVDEVEEAFEAAAREARGAFGRGECFVERFLERPRHVEAQVVADAAGGVVVLGTRDCSLQRRNQKLVEEAPAPFLTEEQRRTLEGAAAAIFREAGYVNAGTCEFLVGADGLISFLEVNTRIQVEHPITEEAYGVDLVGLQLDVAAGEPLPFDEAPAPRGHAIEFRINAEDPGRGFLPAGGAVRALALGGGPGVRVDAGVGPGTTVAGEFDSLLAKLVVTAPTRRQALARARTVLREAAVDGVATTLPFHRAVLARPEFAAEEAEGFGVHTTWIEETLTPDLEPDGGYAAPRFADPWGEDGGSSGPAGVAAAVEVEGRRLRVRLPETALAALGEGLGRHLAAAPGGRGASGGSAGSGASAGAGGSGGADSGEGAADGAGGVVVEAPLAGSLVRWVAEDGAQVAEGERLAVLEAMKTEMPVEAPGAGVFHRAELEPGAKVAAGTQLGRITG